MKSVLDGFFYQLKTSNKRKKQKVIEGDGQYHEQNVLEIRRTSDYLGIPTDCLEEFSSILPIYERLEVDLNIANEQLNLERVGHNVVSDFNDFLLKVGRSFEKSYCIIVLETVASIMERCEVRTSHWTDN
jgi:hypothetical protein